MVLKQKRKVAKSFDDAEIDIDKPFDVHEEEFDDVHNDLFGRPVSKLYRVDDPPISKVHEKALKALERLKRRHGWT